MPPQANRLPRVSVGMPVYNGARYVEEAISSLLAQTMTDFELVISDNGSTDGTESICRQFAARDSRIRFQRYEQNRGASWNFNNAFHLSRAPYFLWAAHDDKWHADFLGECAATLDARPDAVLVYPVLGIIDENSTFVERYTDSMNLDFEPADRRYRQYHDVIRGRHQCNPIFGMFRREVLAQTRLIGPYVSSDTVLLGEIAMRGRIVEVPTMLFFLREHDQDSTHANWEIPERLLWFDTNTRGKLHLREWRFLCEYLRANLTAPMTLAERARCLGVTARWAARERRLLVRLGLKFLLWPVLRHHARFKGHVSAAVDEAPASPAQRRGTA